MKKICFLSVLAGAVCPGGVFAADVALNWRSETYEPQTPVLATNAGVVGADLCGRAVSLDRITPENAAGNQSAKTWRAAAWRNERVQGQFVVWSGSEIPQLRMTVSPLKRTDGATLPASAVQTRFVRYVLAKGKLVGDILDTAENVDLPKNGFRPVWLTATVPENAAPGVYKGTLTVKGFGGRAVAFPLELEVLAATLPAPKDWAFFLDLWQHPWAVARYHGVKPFSPEHYRLLEPIYRELASAGQKVLTTTITDLPWNHQNFDAYYTMIEHIKGADGSWSRDYSIFDQYVAFGKKCGIGPHIHCYTMATWGNRVFYRDAASGDKIAVSLKPGTPEHEAFWGPFLVDFQKHLEQKGWADETYMAMDERGEAEMRATENCLKKYAPRLKIAMPGSLSVAHLQAFDIGNYCQFIDKSGDQAFLAEAQKRAAQGKITTFYVCCGPARPNTFLSSPTSEQVWLGCYTAAKGLSGFLRWAFVNWPRDPLYDSGFGNWAPGDTFFLYPGPRSSVRWEMLRDGIEEAEKIRVLRNSHADMKEVDAILATYSFPDAAKASDDAIRAQVQQTRQAIEKAARGK